MKNILSLTLLFCSILTSCKDHDEAWQELTLDAGYVYLQPGGQKTVTITGGNGNYKISGGESDVANAELQSNRIVITGMSYGSMVVSLYDGSGKSAEIAVRVTHGDEEGRGRP